MSNAISKDQAEKQFGDALTHMNPRVIVNQFYVEYGQLHATITLPNDPPSVTVDIAYHPNQLNRWRYK